MKRAAVLGLFVVVALSACERQEQPKEATATAPALLEQAGSDKKEEADEVHLGAVMDELSRRFASIWFAAEAKNEAFVDYQIHEMEEVIDHIREARPMERGVDIVEFFDANIFPALEKVEDRVEEGQDFQIAYDAVIQQCNACHTATEHEFIKVKRPEFNPYSSLDINPN